MKKLIMFFTCLVLVFNLSATNTVTTGTLTLVSGTTYKIARNNLF